jgi:hypothetical protein
LELDLVEFELGQLLEDVIGALNDPWKIVKQLAYPKRVAKIYLLRSGAGIGSTCD